MDASAYLQRHGWRGDGHSLDHSDRGIKKPLLVSKKVDVLGVGLNKHQAVSDQWWLRAFDQGLKTFGTGRKSALGEVQKHGVNRGGLYARFTQGEGVPGSIGQSPVTGSEVNSGSSTPVGRSVGQGRATVVDSSAHLKRNEADGEAKGKKRKRAEGSEDRSARRKVERREKSERPERDDEIIVNGEEAAQRRKAKKSRRKAKDYVLEAQQRGVIPMRPSSSEVAAMPSRVKTPDEEFLAIMDLAGLDPWTPYHAAADQSEEAQKRARKKMERKFKRAAEMYLSGEASENGNEGKTRNSTTVAASDAADVQSEAEKLARKKDEAQRRKQRRAEKKADDETSSVLGVKVAKEKQRLKPGKLAKYEARANGKGLSLDDYLRRRKEKHAAKKRKKRRKMGDD